MRLPSIILGFSLGAFLMWRIGVPVPTEGDCAPGPDCAPAETALASPPDGPAAPALRIVVYDPNGEGEGLPADAAPPRPVSVRVPVSIPAVASEAGAGRGACAVVFGRELGCVTFVNPGDPPGAEVSDRSLG